MAISNKQIIQNMLEHDLSNTKCCYIIALNFHTSIYKVFFLTDYDKLISTIERQTKKHYIATGVQEFLYQNSPLFW